MIIYSIKIVNPGIFWKNYAMCEIETKSKDWKITEREEDFHSLRSILVKLYPGHSITLKEYKKNTNIRHESKLMSIKNRKQIKERKREKDK